MDLSKYATVARRRDTFIVYEGIYICHVSVLAAYQDMVLASGGNVIDGARYTELEGTQSQKKRVKVEKAKLPLVPAHLMGTDVSSVKQSSTIFEGCVFCILCTHAACCPLQVLMLCAGKSAARYKDNLKAPACRRSRSWALKVEARMSKMQKLRMTVGVLLSVRLVAAAHLNNDSLGPFGFST